MSGNPPGLVQMWAKTSQHDDCSVAWLRSLDWEARIDFLGA